jgi:hypothetical protein
LLLAMANLEKWCTTEPASRCQLQLLCARATDDFVVDAASHLSGLAGRAEALDQRPSPKSGNSQRIARHRDEQRRSQKLHGRFADDDAFALLFDAKQSGQALFVL